MWKMKCMLWYGATYAATVVDIYLPIDSLGSQRLLLFFRVTFQDRLWSLGGNNRGHKVVVGET
jgi:alpha-glucuronidase